MPLTSASPSFGRASPARSPRRRAPSAAGARVGPRGRAPRPRRSAPARSAPAARGRRWRRASRARARPASSPALSERDHRLGDQRPRTRAADRQRRARRSIIARTTSRSTGGPMPAACERTSARCSSSRRSGGIRVVASEPNPVETPPSKTGRRSSDELKRTRTSVAVLGGTLNSDFYQSLRTTSQRQSICQL